MSAPAPLDRSLRPEPAPAVPFRAPVPEVVRLRCGAELWALPRRDLPIVAASVALPVGAAAHGPDRGGLAGLTAQMLDEGTAGRSAHRLALEAESLGTSLSSSCGWDGSYVGLQCVTPHLEASLDLAVDILRRPTFPEGEWRRVHAQNLAALRAERDSAEGVAYRAFLRTIYGEGHPYRVPADGEEASVLAIGRDDLARFHADYYGGEGAAWVVAGDVDPDRIARLLDDRLDGWGGPRERRPPVPEAAGLDGRRLVLIDRPGSAQAVLRVGHVGARRLDPDYTDLLVLNHILGGQFTSRLNAKLREEKGLTYGVRSGFDFRGGAGPFAVSASVQTDRVAEALEAATAELEGLIGAHPPTLPELEDARRSLIEGQARHFETPSALVSRYAGLFVHALPPDHHARAAERLSAVHVEGLTSAGLRHIRPTHLTAVIVGDAERIRGPLEAIGWTPLDIRDPA